MANIIEIDNLHAAGVDIFSRLTEAQLRNKIEPQKGIFIAESPKVIHVALDAGYEPIALLTTRKHIDGQAKTIIERCGAAPIYTGDETLLEQLTGYELTRGVLCAMRRPPISTLEQVCHDAKNIAVIDGVVNATNIGAIFRAAAALGMDAILLTHTCCDPLNRRSVRVSMGTVFQIPWTYIGLSHCDWPHPGLDQIHKLGFRTAAMALSNNSIDIDNHTFLSEEKIAIILGNEGDGLDAETIKSCNYVVRIPMQRGVDSLNVAGAASIAFWQLQKRCQRVPE